MPRDAALERISSTESVACTTKPRKRARTEFLKSFVGGHDTIPRALTPPEQGTVSVGGSLTKMSANGWRPRTSSTFLLRRVS